LLETSEFCEQPFDQSTSQQSTSEGSGGSPEGLISQKIPLKLKGSVKGLEKQCIEGSGNR
jgi:hypothetical protein